MATRSTIALEYADGTVGQIYCHWDGYLQHNGHILFKHYADPFKVRELLDRGDTSTLDKDISGCDFYSNRGEKCPQRMFKDINEYFADCQQEEYDYILTRKQGWLVRCYATGGWVSIPEAFEMEATEEV